MSHTGVYRAVWLIVAQGGWWTASEIAEHLPLKLDPRSMTNRLWIMEKRCGQLVSRLRGDLREYSLAPGCKLPVGLTASDVVGALVGQDTKAAAPRSDLWLMRNALGAIDGLIELGAHRGVKPTDITLTTRDGLRRRLAGSALQQHEWGKA